MNPNLPPRQIHFDGQDYPWAAPISPLWPATGTLTDNFDDNSTDTALWSTFGSAVESGGQLTLNGSTGGQYSGYTSIGRYSLVDSSVYIELKNAGNQALTSWEVYPVQMYLPSGNSNSLYWLITNNTVQAYTRVNGSNTTVGSSFAYNSSTHKWFRIRADVDGATLYYDYSTDGLGWTNHTSTASPFSVKDLKVEPVAGNWNTEASAPSAVFDNLNVAPSGGGGGTAVSFLTLLGVG